MSLEIDEATQWTVVVIVISIDVFMLCPLLSYNLAKYTYSNNKSQYHLHIIKWINLLGILFILIFMPLMKIYHISPIVKSYYPSYSLSFAKFLHIIAYWITHSGTFLIITRYWIMFYQSHYQNSLIHKQWKVYLNPTLIQSDFWMKYKPTLGTEEFCIKLSLLTSISASTMMTTLNLYTVDSLKGSRLFCVADTAFCLLPVVILSILYCKIPDKLSSEFLFPQIKYEVKGAIAVIITVVTSCMVSLYKWRKTVLDETDTHEIIQRCVYLIPYGLSVVLYMIYITRTSLYSPRIQYTKNKVFKRSKKEYDLVNNTSYDIDECKESDIDSKCMSLTQILSNEHQIEPFIHYLCRIGKLEIIMGFIELVQFKHEIQINNVQILNTLQIVSDHTLCTIPETGNIINDNYDMHNNDYYSYALVQNICNNPKIIPRSSILATTCVYNDQTQGEMESFVRIAHKLCFKYIFEGKNTEYVSMDRLLISAISMTLKKCYMIDMDISLDDLLQKQRNKKVFQNIQDLFEYFDPLIKDLYKHLKELHSSYVESI